MPNPGSDITYIAQTAPGVVMNTQSGYGNFVAEGMPAISNLFTINGQNYNDPMYGINNSGASNLSLGLNDLAEASVITSPYSAQYGQYAGSQIAYITKSGTNQWHGNAWEFVRNDIFDAANFFENSPSPTAKGEYRQNQFGATIGGPIRKDKTFIFGDYEGTRIRQASPWVSSVPTDLESSSGFTNLSELLTQGGTQTDALGRNFALGQVFDPSTTRGVACGVGTR